MSDDPCLPPTMAPGEEKHGFRVSRVLAVPEIRATAYEAQHIGTGAPLLHLHCPDRESLFAITFRTPPPDSTGVAHILEHSVLAGSVQYPVRDAFTELGKGSLKTFINAFTAGDFTCYPVASQAKADFYNLVTVYLDLVLRPLLRRETFLQEGHHLEVKDDGKLAVTGIVYNEMKGAYSHADGIASRQTIQRLLPDTPYGFESGGDPEFIPDLTYEGFQEFHRRYYAPSNSRIFLYGDIPIEEHLSVLGRILDGFARTAVESEIPLQPRWSQPRTALGRFPIGTDESRERRSIVHVAWLTARVDQPEDLLLLEVLENALIGNAGSPLRKALIDSGLGEDLSSSSGLMAWMKEVPFVVGLRGTDPGSAEAIEALTLRTLTSLAEGGIDRTILEAAMHQVEFRGLEISRSPMPFPVTLLFRTLGSGWIHGRDPIPALRFPTRMGELRRRWEQDPDLFREALRRWLVDNPHRLRAIFEPSPELAPEREAQLAARLETRRAGMAPEAIEEIRRTTEELRESQRRPESPDALATLPVLRVEEVPREAITVPTAGRDHGGALWLDHDIFSGGIAYCHLAFDVTHVPENLQGYLPLLGAAATGMGAAGSSYEAFATRKAAVSGGIEADLAARLHARGGPAMQRLILSGRALRRNAPELVALLRDIVTAGDLTDLERLRDIVAEERNSLRAAMTPQGHSFTWRAAGAGLSIAAARDEQWNGVTQLRFLNDLNRRFQSDAARVRDDLLHLRELVFVRQGLTANLTGEAECLAAMRAPVEELLAALPPGTGREGAGAATAPAAPFVRPGICIPGQVCFVARVLPSPGYVAPESPCLNVLSTWLASGLFYKTIRVEGGAYGGYTVFNPGLRQFALLSYRDPLLAETLEFYDRFLDDFEAENLAPDAVGKAVISTIGAIDRPLDPVTQGYIAMERHLTGITNEDRQRYRERVLAVGAEALRQAAREVLRPALASAADAVSAPRERIVEANTRLAKPFELIPLD